MLFGLPKAELVRRLIRAAVQAGPALSAKNTETVITLARQLRRVGMNLAQILNAIHRGQAVGMADTEAVWRGLHEALSSINDELSDMTVAYGSKLRRAAKLHVTAGADSP